MVLTPAEYSRILPNNPFTQPPNPGILIPNLNGTAAQIVSAENNHCLTKKLYLETLLLERTFIQHIIKAIDIKYLAALRNPVTVPTILKFLRNSYEGITPQQLDDKTTTVKTMIYDPEQPINIIFNSIYNLV